MNSPIIPTAEPFFLSGRGDNARKALQVRAWTLYGSPKSSYTIRLRPSWAFRLQNFQRA